MVFAERKPLMNGKVNGQQINGLQTSERQDDKCINCKAAKPGYICLEFVTFVCQECSDIHRGFGHKIASIDHSEWTEEEFEEIKKGGNKVAAEEYLAFWNQSDIPRPSAKDTEKLRDFIRKAYVIKCWQRQPDPNRQPRRPWSEISSGSTSQNDSEASGDAEAGFSSGSSTSAGSETTQQSEAAAADAPAAAGAPNAAAAPPLAAPSPAFVPGPGNLILLPKDSACFCPNHDSTEKREKKEPAFRCCNGCKITLQTNYSSFAYCPGCSAQRSLCMICGTAVAPPPGSQYGPDGMPQMTSRPCPNGGDCSDGNQTDATSAGNAERGEVDFSSDAESAEASGGGVAAPVAVSGAIAGTPAVQGGAAIRSLMDLDIVEAAPPALALIAVAAPAPAAAEEASPDDWLGEALPIGAVAAPAAAATAIVLAGPLSTAPEGVQPVSANTEPVPAPAAVCEALGAAQEASPDDWLGEALPVGAVAVPAAAAATIVLADQLGTATRGVQPLSANTEPAPAPAAVCEALWAAPEASSNDWLGEALPTATVAPAAVAPAALPTALPAEPVDAASAGGVPHLGSGNDSPVEPALEVSCIVACTEASPNDWLGDALPAKGAVVAAPAGPLLAAAAPAAQPLEPHSMAPAVEAVQPVVGGDAAKPVPEASCDADRTEASPNDWLGNALPVEGAVVAVTAGPLLAATAPAAQPSEPRSMAPAVEAVPLAVGGDAVKPVPEAPCDVAHTEALMLPREAQDDLSDVLREAAPNGHSAAAEAPSSTIDAGEPQAQAALSDDWLGDAIVSGGSPTPAPSCPSVAAATDLGDMFGVALTSQVEQCEEVSKVELSKQGTPANDLFGVLDGNAFGMFSVEARPAKREPLLETPRRRATAPADSDPEGNLGDKLRDAVMKGSTDAVLGVFRECSTPTRVPAEAVDWGSAERANPAPDRFAALGELPVPGQRLPPSQLPSPAFRGGLMQMGSPMSNRGMADLSPAIVSPQQLDDMPAEHLAQMHAMVTRALHNRSQAASPVASPAVHQMSPAGGVQASHWGCLEEQQPAQFGDVLTAFHERNAAWQDKHSATTPAKAVESSPSSTKETPKEFGDLLEAFHKKNPIVGLNSPA